MPKRQSPNGVRRVHPAADDQTHSPTESLASRLSPVPGSMADIAQRGGGPRRSSLNSVESTHSDSSKDEGKSPAAPASFVPGKRRTSINSLTSVGSDDSERRMSHFSEKARTLRHKTSANSSSKFHDRKFDLTNFKVPAILLLSSKFFNAIYVTSKKMLVFAILSVVMCVIENEIWFSVQSAAENQSTEAVDLVLSDSQALRANICKATLSGCTAMLCFYITVYYKELLELKKLKQSDLDTVLHDQSNFWRSGLVYSYLLEMLVCLIHIPFGMDVSLEIEFRSIRAFYRGEMIVTLVIFMRLYHVVRVIRDWTLIRFKNAMFLSKLVHVEQDNAYALKVLLHENPVMFVLCGLGSTLVIFGYLLRIYDTTARPLSEGFGLSQAYWISLLSLTTVGYGDDVPKSHLGRIMVVLLVYIGSILIPLQIAIVERLLQFNIQEDRMIRVYRLEQKRHAFHKAAVQLVVSWYRSIKSGKRQHLGEHLLRWKKFRMSHASNSVHNVAEHNNIDKNISAVATSLGSSIQELTTTVSAQTNESRDLSRRCNENMQAMQSIADRLATLLHNNDNKPQLRATMIATQKAYNSRHEVSLDSKMNHMDANSSIVHEDIQQPPLSKAKQTANHRIEELGHDGQMFSASVAADQGRAAGLDDPSEQPTKASLSQYTQQADPKKSSVGYGSSAGSVGHVPESMVASQRVPGSVMTPASPQIRNSSTSQSHDALELVSPRPLDEHDGVISGQMHHHHQVSEKILSKFSAEDNVYSNSAAHLQMPNEVSGHGNQQNGHQLPLQRQIHQISRQRTYHNESADVAYSQSEVAPNFVESEVPIEGFYPPPHSYSPEAIQFHRDRIYEQARPSLSSILRSSPGLLPTSDTARLRSATYYSAKSPPIPLLTRPNSPGPKGFTPVRVKPFNPQGVISPIQGSAPSGSSSAYAKFLLARSEYKPDSTTHHSP
jgi:hypothetical protein